MKILVLGCHTESLLWFRFDMMRYWVNLGNEVYATGQLPVKDWDETFSSIGVHYIQIPVSRNGLNPYTDYNTYKALRQLIKDIKPDKLFLYQAKTISYGCLAAHNLGITEIYPMVGGLGSIFRGKGLQAKIAKFIMSTLYRRAFKYSKAIFLQNEDDREELIRHNLLERDKTFITNGSGVNLDYYDVTPLPSKTSFLFVGRLLKDKGIMEYLQACKKIKDIYPDVDCGLVGPFDTNTSAINRQVLEPYITSKIIRYYGVQKDVRPYITRCNVFILPSYHEGTPKTVLEAMAMGRTIITTDAPGCKNTVVNGVNGFLVKVKSVDEIVEKMIYFIENPSICKKMGDQSREIAKEKFDVNKVNDTISTVMGIH